MLSSDWYTTPSVDKSCPPFELNNVPVWAVFTGFIVIFTLLIGQFIWIWWCSRSQSRHRRCRPSSSPSPSTAAVHLEMMNHTPRLSRPQRASSQQGAGGNVVNPDHVDERKRNNLYEELPVDDSGTADEKFPWRQQKSAGGPSSGKSFKPTNTRLTKFSSCESAELIPDACKKANKK